MLGLNLIHVSERAPWSATGWRECLVDPLNRHCPFACFKSIIGSDLRCSPWNSLVIMQLIAMIFINLTTLIHSKLYETDKTNLTPLTPTCEVARSVIVRRAGLLWSQQDFEWRWSVPLFKCLTVLEFSFILFDLCLLITFFNFIMNYVPIVTFWIFTYHKIWILSIMFCFIWSYWIIYFLACLEVSWRVVS